MPADADALQAQAAADDALPSGLRWIIERMEDTPSFGLQFRGQIDGPMARRIRDGLEKLPAGSVELSSDYIQGGKRFYHVACRPWGVVRFTYGGPRGSVASLTPYEDLTDHGRAVADRLAAQ